jgi:enterochelin esterase-like enzyme
MSVILISIVASVAATIIVLLGARLLWRALRRRQAARALATDTPPGNDRCEDIMPEQDETIPLASPRLIALRERLASGESAALAAFWSERREQGTPLIEPVEGDPAHQLVTFVWQGSPGLCGVAVAGGPAGIDPARNPLAHLAQRDVWYRTYSVPTNLRTTYWLVPDDPLTPVPDEEKGLPRAGWHPDPLNPRRFVAHKDEEDPSDRDFVASVLELSGAPPQPWIVPRDDIPHGTVALHRLRSARLGNERRLWVYTPPGYAADHGPYSLLIVFDGFAYREVIPTPVILDNLQAAGHLPAMVAVLVDSLDALRSTELTCHPPFAEFLAQELLPWVHERYAVTTDPARVIVAGSSLGGLAAAYVAWRYPDCFGNVLSQSGTFARRPDATTEPGWLIRQYVEAPRQPLRFYLEVGLLENDVVADEATSLLASNRHLRDVLQAKGYPVAYAEYSGGHDYIVWRGTFADGLVALNAVGH